MNDTPLPSSAAAPADGPADAPDNQFVTFYVAGEMFAVPMAPVQEIIRVPEIAGMPMAPAALDGLANLRGRVLPIVDLRRLFDAPVHAHDDATRALVINLGQPLGFVVDKVASVVSVEPHEIEPARSIQSFVADSYLNGVINRAGPDGERQLMLVLDFDRLVADQFSMARRGQGGSRTGGDLAPPAAAEAPAVTDELRLVSFTVDRQEYAIDIADVQEIVQVPAGITAVPNAPGHVLGLISLRQRLLPLLSLRGLFDLAPVPADEHHRIVVVAMPCGAQVGLVTDTVKEVLSVPRAQADPMPAILARGAQLQEVSAICRLDQGKRLVSIIATDRLLNTPAVATAFEAVARHDGTTDAIEDPTMARHATPRDTTADDDAQVVIFRLGAEEFGVPIMSVQEIVRVPEVLMRVPKTPPFVEGVINLRGTVLPVIDQRSRLGMRSIERNDRQRIMVYTLAGIRTGFIVDSVAEVLRIGRGQIEAAPELSKDQSKLITQVAKIDGDKRLVMLIDPSQLLGTHEADAVEAALDGKPEDGNGVTADEPSPLRRAA